MKDEILGSAVSRRSTLKTIGAVGAFSLAGFTGTAAAKNEDKTYGNGNGIGAFLNEETEIKDTPIWTGGVVDMRGESMVEVEVGVTTDIRPQAIDIGPPFGEVTLTEAPLAYDPLVVRVSPGATVKWVWSDDLLAPVPGVVEFPIPHNVVAVEDRAGNVAFDSGEEEIAPASFTHQFDVPGNYLYYCAPHGAPGNNFAGMRGAVKIGGKAI